ncbi:MAG: hypothetical protein ACMVO3_22125 [Thalassobaculum sp.]
MTVMVSVIWFGQFFLAGLPMIFVGGLAGLGALGAVGAYLVFPHVASRVRPVPGSGIGRHLSGRPRPGGLRQRRPARHRPGRGYGEGRICRTPMRTSSSRSPARNSAVIACLLIVALFAFVVLRGFAKLLSGTEPVRPAGGGRTADPGRPAGADQHGVSPSA